MSIMFMCFITINLYNLYNLYARSIYRPYFKLWINFPPIKENVLQNYTFGYYMTCT